MNIPTREEAKAYLTEAERMNPGPWVSHSLYVAQAAGAIATYCPSLDPEEAYILGCLHDIGRRVGVMGIRHIMAGYSFLQARGFDSAARICLTHSFPLKDVRSASSQWDGTEEEYQFVQDYLTHIQFDDYEKLIQLCDALALPTGFCLIEKRLVDVTLRYGFNSFTLPKWKSTFCLQREIESIIGRSVYSILPGVVENTFGFSPE